MLQGPHEHFKIDFTPNLSSQQHVKYGSILIKCHEDLLTLETLLFIVFLCCTWAKICILGYLGEPWGRPLCNNCYQNSRAARPHHRANRCITRGKNNHQLFIYGPEFEKFAFLAIQEGLSDPLIILSPISIYI